MLSSKEMEGKDAKWVDHVVVATVAEYIQSQTIVNLIRDLKAATELPGVLATHVGRCEPMLDEHTFMIHIRAADTASCDAACRAASEVYGKHLTLRNSDGEDDFANIVIVDLEPDVLGQWGVQWNAIRIAIFSYREDCCEQRKEELIEMLHILPTRFPSIKQLSWGKNVAKSKTYRKYYGGTDLDYEVGVILGFNSCKEMYALGKTPEYWELLNIHLMSLLEKYQVLTLCVTQPSIVNCTVAVVDKVHSQVAVMDKVHSQHCTADMHNLAADMNC